MEENSINDRDRVGNIEKALNYNFSDDTILLCALTHKSFSNEHKEFTQNNQRLEFLGDAVIGLVIAEELMNRMTDAPEGVLTQWRASLVNENSLANIAKTIELGKYLRLGRGEIINDGRYRISNLADAMEALIGAVYKDGGYLSTQKVLLELFKKHMENVACENLKVDVKSRLQELLQSKEESEYSYNLVSEEGPDHNKIFIVELLHGDKRLSLGEGKTKKQAEKQAASAALAILED